MSFLDIKDPKKRVAIVSDYLATVKRLQQKNLNEKAQDLVRRDDIELALEPVVRSAGQSTEAITKELIPIKDEIKAPNERLETQENDREKHQQEQEEESKDESQPNIVQVYYQKVPREKLDKYFDVIMEGGRYKMGDKYVHVKGSRSPGLWSLIMKIHPTAYSREDLITYRDVILHTNAMSYPNNLEPTSRVTSTKKWREIFPLFDEVDEEEEEEEEKESSSHHHRGSEVTRSIKQQHGNGVVQFLPGDIEGLETKMNYLIGEYRAGNRLSTRILDELLRRRKITRKEYKDIKMFLQ